MMTFYLMFQFVRHMIMQEALFSLKVKSSILYLIDVSLTLRLLFYTLHFFV